MGTNVNLTPQLLDERDREKALRLERLRAEIDAGVTSGRSQAWDPAEVRAQGRAKRAARKRAAEA
jgi:Arc/MetJ-type ribon-helix-helix transcriptional regulator